MLERCVSVCVLEKCVLVCVCVLERCASPASTVTGCSQLMGQ